MTTSPLTSSDWTMRDKPDSGEQSGEGPSRSSSSEVTTSTGRTFHIQPDGLVHRQPDNPTRWSRRSGDSGGLASVPEHSMPDTPADGHQGGGVAQPEDASGETGPAASYYNSENRKFRRNGPVRMARKQRIWDDWLSWRDNWRMEQRGGNGGGRSRPPPESDQDEQRRDKEWENHMAQVRGNVNTSATPSPPPEEEWVQDVHGQWFQISGPLPGKRGTSKDQGKGLAHSGSRQDDHWSRYRRGRDAHSHHQSGGWGQAHDGTAMDTGIVKVRNGQVHLLGRRKPFAAIWRMVAQ